MEEEEEEGRWRWRNGGKEEGRGGEEVSMKVRVEKGRGGRCMGQVKERERGWRGGRERGLSEVFLVQSVFFITFFLHVGRTEGGRVEGGK